MRSKNSLSKGDSEAARHMANGIYEFLNQKKIDDLLLIDLSQVNPYFRFFLIATAQSSVQLKSLTREIQKQFGASGRLRPEDISSGWVIIDYIDTVVHLFLKEQREYYNLEQLWGDARVLQREKQKMAGLT